MLYTYSYLNYLYARLERCRDRNLHYMVGFYTLKIEALESVLFLQLN